MGVWGCFSCRGPHYEIVLAVKPSKKDVNRSKLYGPKPQTPEQDPGRRLVLGLASGTNNP